MDNGLSIPHAMMINSGMTHRQIWVDEPTAMPVGKTDRIVEEKDSKSG